MFELFATFLFVLVYYLVGDLYVRWTVAIFYLVLVLPGIYSMIFGAPFLSTSKKRMKAILELGDFSERDVVYDLGCGNGNLMGLIADRGVKKAIGYEFSVFTFLYARVRKIFSKSKAEIVFGNFWKKDFSDADVVVCFLMENTMKRFEREIWPKLKSGARVISNEFLMESVEPVKNKGKVFLFIKK